MLHRSIFFLSLLAQCNAIPQAVSSTALSPSSSSVAILWKTKVDALRDYILQQPDQNATKGFWNGPALQQTFSDGECLQVRFYNWDCNHDVPYKMRGVATWLMDTIGRENIRGISDAYRFYTYGRYVDPDDGWNFYGVSRLSFGACGNRGPQSSCGTVMCLKEDGAIPGVDGVPKGQNPWMDPSNRDRLCPWLKGNGTGTF